MKFCDLSCEYAKFPDKLSDGSNSCRTFVGIYCKKLERVVDKNGPCLDEIDNKNDDDQKSIKSE